MLLLLSRSSTFLSNLQKWVSLKKKEESIADTTRRHRILAHPSDSVSEVNREQASNDSRILRQGHLAVHYKKEHSWSSIRLNAANKYSIKMVRMSHNSLANSGFKLRGGATAWYYGMMALAVFFVVMNSLMGDSSSSSSNYNFLAGSGSSGVDNSVTTPEKVAENQRKMKEVRAYYKDRCTKVKNSKDMEDYNGAMVSFFTQTPPKIERPRGDAAVVPCRSVVMDFGANIGDTSGHVMDAGMLQCDRQKDLALTSPFVHFDTVSKKFVEIKRRNPLTRQLVHLMQEFGPEIGPEDYCYYGVEGNPVFTNRLRAIEDHVMQMTPRPIQHMHFFTESVGAGVDGPTKLYLDTINTEQNFWGSSIFANHQDVRKSNEDSNSSTLIAADVEGYTIGRLMRNTLLAFRPGATEADKKGNHLVLKVDIEGGEYPLLHQAVEEGTLCEFVKMGNKADLFIEFHSQKVTGKHEFVGKTKQMKAKLTACGVNFRNLAAWWA